MAFVYGKKMQQPKRLFLGLALMLFPYIVTDALWMWIVGSVLTAAAWSAA